MKKLFFISIILILPFLQSCQNSSAFSGGNSELPEVSGNEHLVMAVAYQQNAAEYKALCYQAFNLAKLRLDASSRMLGGMKAKAVVVDIDETMLDNSPYEGKCILDNINYPESWDQWMNKESAKAVPGALEFTRYAQQNGIQVFYISNRKDKYRKQTLSNLKNVGFPYADDEHLMLKKGSDSKKERREEVLAKWNIIVFIGDNLNDFSEVFENKSNSERAELAQKMENDFGNRFIVLPNAMYGDWEGAIYNYDYSLKKGQKDDLLKAALKGFK